MEGRRLRLVETTVLPDVWIDGIGKIEKIAADTYRLLLYRTRRPIEGGPDEHEVVLSVVASGSSAGAALALVNTFIERGAEEALAMVALIH